jgi:hypothetical protein
MALPYYLSFQLSEVALVHISSDNRDCTVYMRVCVNNIHMHNFNEYLCEHNIRGKKVICRHRDSNLQT